jgi:hypothetical protein
VFVRCSDVENAAILDTHTGETQSERREERDIINAERRPSLPADLCLAMYSVPDASPQVQSQNLRPHSVSALRYRYATAHNHNTTNNGAAILVAPAIDHLLLPANSQLANQTQFSFQKGIVTQSAASNGATNVPAVSAAAMNGGPLHGNMDMDTAMLHPGSVFVGYPGGFLSPANALYGNGTVHPSPIYGGPSSASASDMESNFAGPSVPILKRRKRARHPELWKRNNYVRKQLKDKGACDCTKKCFTLIPLQDREESKQLFASLNKKSQDQHLLSLIVIEDKRGGGDASESGGKSGSAAGKSSNEADPSSSIADLANAALGTEKKGDSDAAGRHLRGGKKSGAAASDEQEEEDVDGEDESASDDSDEDQEEEKGSKRRTATGKGDAPKRSPKLFNSRYFCRVRTGPGPNDFRLIRVCHYAFLSIHGIGKKRVNNLVLHAYSSGIQHQKKRTDAAAPPRNGPQQQQPSSARSVASSSLLNARVGTNLVLGAGTGVASGSSGEVLVAPREDGRGKHANRANKISEELVNLAQHHMLHAFPRYGILDANNIWDQKRKERRRRKEEDEDKKKEDHRKQFGDAAASSSSSGLLPLITNPDTNVHRGTPPVQSPAHTPPAAAPEPVVAFHPPVSFNSNSSTLTSRPPPRYLSPHLTLVRMYRLFISHFQPVLMEMEKMANKVTNVPENVLQTLLFSPAAMHPATASSLPSVPQLTPTAPMPPNAGFQFQFNPASISLRQSDASSSSDHDSTLMPPPASLPIRGAGLNPSMSRALSAPVREEGQNGNSAASGALLSETHSLSRAHTAAASSAGSAATSSRTAAVGVACSGISCLTLAQGRSDASHAHMLFLSRSRRSHSGILEAAYSRFQ